MSEILIKKIKVAGEAIYPATILDAVKDSKATINDVANPDYGKTLREILKRKENESKMEDGYTSGVTIGGLNNGTDVGGMTAEEVLDLILKPEYAPTFTDATAAIACTGHTNGEVVEVGTKTPTEASYTSTGNVAKATAGSNVAEGGAATVTFAINSATAGTNLTYDTATTKPGVFKVRVSRTYAVGTDTVKSNKGTETRKIATNSTTLLENASNSANVNTEYHITARTKTADFTINYAYKVYASTVTAGTLTSQGLKTTVSEVEATLKGGAAGQMFAVPASYTGVKIEEWNDTLGSYTDVTDTWTGTASTETLATNGTAYTVYKRNNNSGEDMKARISATVA